LKVQRRKEKQREVLQDLQIVIRKIDCNSAKMTSSALTKFPPERQRSGLRRSPHSPDEQTPNERRAAAVARIRKYAGLEPGYQPLTEILKQRVKSRWPKPGRSLPCAHRDETELGRTSSFVGGMATLMEKYKIEGWQEPYEKLKTQLPNMTPGQRKRPTQSPLRFPLAARRVRAKS